MCCGGDEKDKYSNADLADPSYDGEPVDPKLK